MRKIRIKNIDATVTGEQRDHTWNHGHVQRRLRREHDDQ